jgi:hypothetical protein
MPGMLERAFTRSGGSSMGGNGSRGSTARLPSHTPCRHAGAGRAAERGARSRARRPLRQRARPRRSGGRQRGGRRAWPRTFNGDLAASPAKLRSRSGSWSAEPPETGSFNPSGAGPPGPEGFPLVNARVVDGAPDSCPGTQSQGPGPRRGHRALVSATTGATTGTLRMLPWLRRPE